MQLTTLTVTHSCGHEQTHQTRTSSEQLSKDLCDACSGKRANRDQLKVRLAGLIVNHFWTRYTYESDEEFFVRIWGLALSSAEADLKWFEEAIGPVYTGRDAPEAFVLMFDRYSAYVFAGVRVRTNWRCGSECIRNGAHTCGHGHRPGSIASEADYLNHTQQFASFR